MNSMTGFGKAEASRRVGTFAVEVSSVNNRFLEIQIRSPKQLAPLDSKIREILGKQVNRGKLTVYVNFREPEGSPNRYPINEAAIRSYLDQLKKLQKKLKIAGEVTMSDLLGLPEVAVAANEGPDLESVWPFLKKALTDALGEMIRMRAREGSTIQKDMVGRLETLSKFTKRVKRDAASSVKKYRAGLHQRVQDLLAGPPPDKLRLEEEVALLADKSDITEECTRLDSHIDQYRKVLRSKGPVGKKLNFLLQELNREANTIASKSTEIKVSRTAISIKEEVEKLREQIQNIE